MQGVIRSKLYVTRWSPPALVCYTSRPRAVWYDHNYAKNNFSCRYEGQRVAVDAYGWLHKAAYCCSYELCEGIHTDRQAMLPQLSPQNSGEDLSRLSMEVDRLHAQVCELLHEQGASPEGCWRNSCHSL